MTVHPLPPPAKPDEILSWRDTTLAFVEVGRCLETIEDRLRVIRATRSINDAGARRAVTGIRAAARRIDRTLAYLDFYLRELAERP